MMVDTVSHTSSNFEQITKTTFFRHQYIDILDKNESFCAFICLLVSVKNS